MMAFEKAWPKRKVIVHQPGAQLPWRYRHVIFVGAVKQNPITRYTAAKERKVSRSALSHARSRGKIVTTRELADWAEAELLARASEAEAATLERSGRVLTSEEFGQLCGVSRQSVNRWKESHAVLTVRLSGRRGDLFPAFQLGENNTVLPWVLELLRRIPDGWDALSFLTARRKSLEGQSHLGLIREGEAGAVDNMLAAADAYRS